MLSNVLSRVLISAVFSTLSIESIAGDATQESGITTSEILESGVNGIPGCINYCLVGVCAHLIINFPDIEVRISPRVQHNNPDFVVSTFRDHEQQPWDEWRQVFGPVEHDIADGIFSVISGDEGTRGYGSYQEEHRRYTEMSPYKEADIVGNPLAFLPLLLTGGSISNQVPDSVSGAVGGHDTHDNLNEIEEAAAAASEEISTQGWQAVYIDNEILDVFSYTDNVENIGNSVNGVSEAMDYLQTMQDVVSNDSFGTGASWGGASIVCPNSVIPFAPYYISAFDTFSWRIPWADGIFHFGDIAEGMVPLMADRPVIGTHVGFGSPGDVSLGAGTWGALYPRTGFVQNSHDGKVASVIAQRALDLVLAEDGDDDTGYVGALYSPGFPHQVDYEVLSYRFRAQGVVGGVWQKIFPKPSYTCTNNLYRDMTLADLERDESAPTSEEQRYMWGFWRRYDCCLNREGEFIADVRFDEICIEGTEVEDPDWTYEDDEEDSI